MPAVTADRTIERTDKPLHITKRIGSTTYKVSVHFSKTSREIYHCSIKIISHGKGKSAVAAAAYRAGEKLTNDFDGEAHDYTHKGGVVHTEILLPGHAPMSLV